MCQSIPAPSARLARTASSRPESEWRRHSPDRRVNSRRLPWSWIPLWWAACWNLATDARRDASSSESGWSSRSAIVGKADWDEVLRWWSLMGRDGAVLAGKGCGACASRTDGLGRAEPSHLTPSQASTPEPVGRRVLWDALHWTRGRAMAQRARDGETAPARRGVSARADGGVQACMHAAWSRRGREFPSEGPSAADGPSRGAAILSLSDNVHRIPRTHTLTTLPARGQPAMATVSPIQMCVPLAVDAPRWSPAHRPSCPSLVRLTSLIRAPANRAYVQGQSAQADAWASPPADPIVPVPGYPGIAGDESAARPAAVASGVGREPTAS